MVAAVDGETNLLRQRLCIMRPATASPIPAIRMASRRGRREIAMSSKALMLKVLLKELAPAGDKRLLANSPRGSTPTKSETQLRRSKLQARNTVSLWFVQNDMECLKKTK